MARIFAPIVPPTDPRQCAPWLNKELRRISGALQQQGRGLSAVARGELPDASGTPIFDLTKYFYKPGISGGQTGFGDTRPSGTLTFSSTSSPTKGNIVFGTAGLSVYDEADDWFGFGTALPLAKLHIVGSTAEVALAPNSVVQVGGSAGAVWANSFYGGPLGFGRPPTGTDALWYQQVDDRTDTQFLLAGGPTNTYELVLGFPTISSGTTSWRIRYSARWNDGGFGLPPDALIEFKIRNSTTQEVTTVSRNVTGYYTSSFVTYEEDIDFTGAGTVGVDANTVSVICHSGTGPFGGLPAGSYWAFDWIEVVQGSGNGDTLQIWENDSASNALDFASDGGSGFDLVVSGDGPLRVTAGGGTSGLRFLTSSTNGRVEVGTAAAANMNLVLSGTRAAQGTLLTSDFITTYLTGLVRIAGGSPANLKILSATDSSGNALWKTAAELGIVSGSSPTFAYIAVTSTYAITTSDYMVDCTNGTFTVTLPTAVGVTGRMYNIKNSTTGIIPGVITIATTGGQTIDGSATAVLQVFNVSVTVMSDGANWKVI